MIASAWQRRRGAATGPRLDFLARHDRTPPLVWVAAAAGALLLALGAQESLALRAQIDRETQRVASHLDRSARRPVVAASAPSFSADAGRTARRLAEQALHPWGEVFAAVEAAAPDGIQWLALEHGTDRPELRLEGIAVDAASALRAVDALATRPGWWRVSLTRLGSVEQQGPGLRFEISARIGPADGASPANSESAR